MKSLKERLEKKIEKESDEVFCVCCTHYGEAYKLGAMSLLPLIVELADRLNEISEKEGMCIFGSSDTSDLPEVAFRQGSAYSYSECARTSKEALQSIDNFLGEK